MTPGITLEMCVNGVKLHIISCENKVYVLFISNKNSCCALKQIDEIWKHVGQPKEGEWYFQKSSKREVVVLKQSNNILTIIRHKNWKILRLVSSNS